MNLFYQPLISNGIHYLEADESKHCIRVLRKQQGDLLHITDGKGFFYDAVVTEDNPKQCHFKITKTIAETSRDYKIHIAISPTKNTDRIEWFVEKAVELGIDTITLMECRNTERTHLKTERLEKVAISAMKQSLKASIPKIQALCAFKDIVNKSVEEYKFIAFVDHENTTHLKDLISKRTTSIVLIGPEGDFSHEELKLATDLGFIKVSLGNSRLRTETAGLAACHILNLLSS